MILMRGTGLIEGAIPSGSCGKTAGFTTACYSPRTHGGRAVDRARGGQKCDKFG